MKLFNSKLEIGAITKFNHWLMAFLVFTLVILGSYMVSLENSPEKFEWFGLHKSLGTLVLLWAIIRIGLNLFNRIPDHTKSHKKWEKFLARATQFSLYSLLILLPLSGWIMSSSGGYSYKFFGVSMPNIVSKNPDLFNVSSQAHELFVLILLAMVFLHVCGALKHHVIDKDKTLTRMLPRKAPKLLLGLVILFYVAGLFMFVLIDEYHEDSKKESITGSSRDQNKVVVDAVKEETRLSTRDVRSWIVQQDNSQIAFSVDISGEKIFGTFSSFNSIIYFDESNLANSFAHITIALDSVNSGSTDRDAMVLEKAWFNISKHPTAEFKTHNISKLDEHQFVAESSLNLRGVSVPLKLLFTLKTRYIEEDNAWQATMSGQATLNRLDFGIGAEEWSDPALVSHTIEVDVDLVALSAD